MLANAGGGRRRERGVRRAHVEIFELRRPLIGETAFNAAANGPGPEIVRGVERTADRIGAGQGLVAPHGAAGQVGHDRAERVACAGAEGAEPGDRRGGADEGGAGAAIDALGQGRALEVDFGADQCWTEQVVVAALRATDEAAAAASEAATGVVLADGSVRVPPQPAGIDAGIEAFPLAVVRLLRAERRRCQSSSGRYRDGDRFLHTHDNTPQTVSRGRVAWWVCAVSRRKAALAGRHFGTDVTTICSVSPASVGCVVLGCGQNPS